MHQKRRTKQKKGIHIFLGDLEVPKKVHFLQERKERREMMNGERGDMIALFEIETLQEGTVPAKIL